MASTKIPPVSNTELNRVQRLNTFLDEHVLLYPVRFLTNRIVILTTLALLIPLILFSNNQAFVNAMNSYLNVTSVAVGSTVLLYATIADIRDRAAAKRSDDLAKTYEQALESRIQEREELAKIYEQVLEKRVKTDHEMIKQILHNMVENMLGGKLEKIQLEEQKQLEEIQKAVIASNELLRAELAEKMLIASNDSLRAEIAEVRKLIQELHLKQFGRPTTSND
jgi:hypothetical protein